MTRRINEHELLAFVEGERLTAKASARLNSALDADPELRRRMEAMRRDKAALAALAFESEMETPEGLTAAAMNEAERESLLGHARPSSIAGSTRRIRVTPMRLAAAACLVILFGSASLIGLVLSGGPSAKQRPGDQIAMGEDRTEESAQSIDDPTPIRARSGIESEDAVGAGGETLALRPAAPTEAPTAMADAAPDTIEAPDATPSADVVPGLSFRLIRPSGHAPDHAVSPDRAAGLAGDGRLLVLIRTSDPERVERALLASAPADDPESPRFRSIATLPGGGAVEAPRDPEAPRVVLVDVRTTHGSMERLIARATEASAGSVGAWLQEIDEPVQLPPLPETRDPNWWRHPVMRWSRLATVPVLIERVEPAEPDAASPDQSPAR